MLLNIHEIEKEDSKATIQQNVTRSDQKKIEYRQ